MIRKPDLTIPGKSPIIYRENHDTAARSPVGVCQRCPYASVVAKQSQSHPLGGHGLVCTRIALVDDHALIRQGVRHFLASEPDFEIVGEAGDAASAYQMICESDPDVVLMDVGLGKESSFALTRRLKATHPKLRILVVTAHTDDAVVSEMLGLGVDGYFLKDMAMEELALAVRAVSQGQFVLHPMVAHRWVSLSHREPPPKSDDDLTPREIEIVRLMADGSTSKEIARRLHLSVKTVENHRANILSKLQAHNSAEAVSRAVDKGFVRSHSVDRAASSATTIPGFVPRRVGAPRS